MPPKVKKNPRKKKLQRNSSVSYRLPYDQSSRIPFPQGKPVTEEFVKQQFDSYITKLGKDPVTNSLDDGLKALKSVTLGVKGLIPSVIEPKLPLTMRQSLSENRSALPIEDVVPPTPDTPYNPDETGSFAEGDTITTIDKLTTVKPDVDMYGALLESEP